MAGKTAQNVGTDANDEGWETIVEPYGATWDFDTHSVLIGRYLSTRTVEQDDLNNPGEKRDANVYEIETADDGEKVSVWGTYSIDQAFEDIEIGKLVRIEFVGKVNLDGGRSVRQFKIQTK